MRLDFAGLMFEMLDSTWNVLIRPGFSSDGAIVEQDERTLVLARGQDLEVPLIQWPVIIRLIAVAQGWVPRARAMTRAV